MATSQTPFEIYKLLSMMTRRLDYNNFITWSYQFQTLLEGQDLFSYIDGISPCPAKNVITVEGGETCEMNAAYDVWRRTDKALLSLLLATLNDDIMDIVVGCKSSREAWLCLQEWFCNTSRANIMQLKTDIQTIKKGNDSMERYLLRIKQTRNKLCAIGVTISDEDIVVITLEGLPDDYAMLKMVIRGRESPITAKDLRFQLLAAERDVEGFTNSSSRMSAMFARGHPQTSHGYNAYCFSAEGYNGGYRSQCSNNDSNYKGSHQGKPYGGNLHNDRGNFYAQNSTTWDGNNKSKGSGSFNYCNGGEVCRNNFGLSSKCQICKNKGHIAINCWYRNVIPLNHPSISVVTCQICGLKGHAALDCRYRSNYTFQGVKPSSNRTTMTAQSTNRASFSGLSFISPAVVDGEEQNVISAVQQTSFSGLSSVSPAVADGEEQNVIRAVKQIELSQDGYDKKMLCQDLYAFSCVAPQMMKQEITDRHNGVFICPEKCDDENDDIQDDAELSNVIPQEVNNVDDAVTYDTQDPEEEVTQGLLQMMLLLFFWIKDWISRVVRGCEKTSKANDHLYMKALCHVLPLQYDLSLLRSMVGALQCLSFSRPDVLFAVHLVFQFLTAISYLVEECSTSINICSNLSLVTPTEIEGRC